jgi:hypothetical protein
MEWAIIILASLCVMLVAYCWHQHSTAGDDLSTLHREIVRLSNRTELFAVRITDARSSLLNSWMSNHETDCMRVLSAGQPGDLIDCDCGTDHYNAVLNDALQHLTTKVKV